MKALVDAHAPRIQRVHCTDDFLVVRLSDGQTLSAPLDRFPALRNGDLNARTNATIASDGQRIHWSSLALEVSLDALRARPRAISGVQPTAS